MSLANTAVTLFRTAPAWRVVLLGAVGCTMLAVLYPPGPPPGSQVSSTYTPQGSGAGTPPGTGAAGSVAPVAPIMPVAPPDPAIAARLRTFEAAMQALSTEAKVGTRCEGLVKAAGQLQPGDRAVAGGASAKGLTEADACRVQLDGSDARFNNLVTRAQAAKEERSARTLEALGQAGKSIAAFDTSRPQADNYSDSLAEARSAQAMMDASDQRLGALAAASGGAQPGATRDVQDRLVAATRALGELDLQRVPATQQALLTAGQRLAERYRISDGHIAAALAALDDLRQVDSDRTRMRLIGAVGQVTAYDRERANEAQRGLLVEASAQARAAALGLTVAAATEFRRSPTVQAHEQLAALLSSLSGIDRAGLTDEQREALGVADQAALSLRESGRRIASLEDSVQAWQQDPSPGTGARVDEAYGAITAFDRQHLTPEQRGAFERAQAAHLVVAGRAMSLTAETKRELPVFVTARDPAAPFLMRFRAALQEAGYRVASDRNEAALLVELDGRQTYRGQKQIGSSTVDDALTEVALRSNWALDRSEFFRAIGPGNGAAGTPERALADSYVRSADSLFRQFSGYVEHRKP